MQFDREMFLNYLKDSKKMNIDLSYLYRLYKNFTLINKITNSDIKGNTTSLRKYEDTIYTVDGKVLSDKVKIKLELENIYSNIDENSNREIYLEAVNLEEKLRSMDLDEDESIIFAKKQISILQAKLGMKFTFFLSAYEIFLEYYRNIYISQVANEEEILKK